MPRKSVTIKPSERVFLAGKTGSGKTYLAKHLLRTFRRLIVIDPKGTLQDWKLKPWNKAAMRKLRRGDDIRARVTFDIVKDIDDAWEALFIELYERGGGDFVVYIDETYGVTNFGSRPSPGLTALYTRGREFKIGMWASTQRPLGVPLIEKSEAEHFFMFRLILKGDRQHMGEFIGEEVAWKMIPHEHGFYYKSVAWEHPVYIPIFNAENMKKIRTPREAPDAEPKRKT